VKEDMVGKTCSTLERDEKCRQNFSRKTSQERNHLGNRRGGG
jgi:hypothetical protein